MCFQILKIYPKTLKIALKIKLLLWLQNYNRSNLFDFRASDQETFRETLCLCASTITSKEDMFVCVDAEKIMMHQHLPLLPLSLSVPL